MKCAICNNEARHYFSKMFQNEEHIRDLLPVSEYYVCDNCGFTMSKTLIEMPKPQWEQLNRVFHETLEKTARVTLLDQPPYIHQIQMLHILSERGVISLDNALDYAAGFGNMVRLLKRYHGKSLLLFDPYMNQNDNDVVYVPENDLGTYDTVFTSAFFEHSTQRAYLDHTNSLVNHDGVMFVYTLVSEEVLPDPNWCYLDPVHSFFHTKKSMDLLMQQWGYEASLYCVPAQTWCLFKRHKTETQDLVDSINSEFQQKYLHFDRGFVFPAN